MAVNWSNVTTWGQTLQTANTNSGSWFWTLTMYGVFAIVLLLSSAWGFEVGLLTASFVGLIMGIFLVYAGLTSWQWLLTFVGIILLEFLYISWTSKKR